MTDTYSIYPLTLSHPHFRKSEPVPVPGSGISDGNGKLIRQDYRGTPEILPPVTVNSETEEGYYLAQGYERAGKMDPAAWVRAHADSPGVDYVPLKYPLWRNIDGKPTLIMTAQEDPDATDEDFEVVEPAEEPEAVAQPTELDNMRAQMAEMSRMMQQMQEVTKAATEEAARLRAEADKAQTATEPVLVQTAVADMIHDAPAAPEPRHKRTYNRRSAP